jgi:ribosomal-protein-alanine N-acetyltransferase
MRGCVVGRGDGLAVREGVIPSRRLPSAHQEHTDGNVVATVSLSEPLQEATEDWRSGLPELAGSLVTLRELRTSDARALFIAMTTDDVTRFIAPPPPSIEGFEKFIVWTHRQRVAGQGACFAVVPRGSDAAIGLFQIRSLQPQLVTAEWGFALAPELWGTGFFLDAAKTAIEFAFDTLGTQRLEARASLANERGNAALRKLGASREAILRKSFLRRGEHHDQGLWTILADEWRNARQWAGTPPGIH